MAAPDRSVVSLVDVAIGRGTVKVAEAAVKLAVEVASRTRPPQPVLVIVSSDTLFLELIAASGFRSGDVLLWGLLVARPVLIVGCARTLEARRAIIARDKRMLSYQLYAQVYRTKTFDRKIDRKQRS